MIASVGCLLWLNGCETSTRLADVFQPGPGSVQGVASASDADPVSTGALPSPPEPGEVLPGTVPKGFPGKDPHDDVSLGKKQFRAANFRVAERHFRRAVEQHPRDLEAWVGLAASYDRLRRWGFADRAYDQAMKISGPQPELLNNWGYSYMLRGDYRRAREILLQAQAQDPANPYIRNNLELLEASFREGKAVQ